MLYWALGRTKKPKNISGKTVLITGGSKGLGFAMAQEFGRRGARVVIAARDGDEIEAAVEKLRAQGIDVRGRVSDIGQRNQAIELVESIARESGIDILVNNAGVIQVGPLGALTLDDFDQAMDIMFWGAAVPSLAVLPHMKARGSGNIVNITSIGGKMSVPHLLPYVAAKAAAVHFSEGLRAELMGSGVHVTTVVPGLMRTGSFINAIFKGHRLREFTLFSLLSSLPGLTIAADDAARRIVLAALRDEPEIILSVPANLGARFQGLAPGLASSTFGLVARVLPSAEEPTEGQQGQALYDEASRNPVYTRAMHFGRQGIERYQAASKTNGYARET